MSYIDELRNTAKSKDNDDKICKKNLTELFIITIKNNIKLNSNGNPNDIEGYYCESYNCFAEDREQYFGKEYYDFDIENPYYSYSLSGGPTIKYEANWSSIKEELEHRIKNEIGYKYCEVMIEDKVVIEKKYAGGGFFGGDRYDTLPPKQKKAIWVHASMSNIGFGNLKEHSPKRLTVTYTSHSTFEKKYG